MARIFTKLAAKRVETSVYIEMTFDKIMRELAAHLKLPGLALIEENECTLAFDDVVVNFSIEDAISDPELHRAPAKIMMRADLGRAAVNDTAALEAMLTANLMGQGTGGGVLAMNQDGCVTLRLCLALAELELKAFLRIIESFVNHAEHWQEELDRQINGHASRRSEESVLRV